MHSLRGLLFLSSFALSISVGAQNEAPPSSHSSDSTQAPPSTHSSDSKQAPPSTHSSDSSKKYSFYLGLSKIDDSAELVIDASKHGEKYEETAISKKVIAKDQFEKIEGDGITKVNIDLNNIAGPSNVDIQLLRIDPAGNLEQIKKESRACKAWNIGKCAQYYFEVDHSTGAVKVTKDENR